MLGVAGIISSLPPPAGSFFPTSLRVTGTSLRVMAHQGQISRSARFRDAHLALSLSLALSSPFALARALAGAEARDGRGKSMGQGDESWPLARSDDEDKVTGFRGLI